MAKQRKLSLSLFFGVKVECIVDSCVRKLIELTDIFPNIIQL